MDGLEKATLKLRQQVTVGRMDEVMLIMFEQVVGLMEEIKDQYGRLYDAINLLISRKRLSTSLANPPEVYREVANVAGRLKKQGLALLIEESQEVYETDASYILFENMTLAILVHLPVGRLGESMRRIGMYRPRFSLKIEPIYLQLSLHGSCWRRQMPIRTGKLSYQVWISKIVIWCALPIIVQGQLSGVLTPVNHVCRLYFVVMHL